MASIEEILGKQINSIKELRAEIKNLQDSLIGVDADSEQFKTTSQQLAAAQEELTKVTRAGKEENNAAKDSIVGMKNEYKALYDQYKLLSDEQRNSDFGKNMAESLETLSSKINDTQKGVGSFKDNIGNYTASVSESFNKMGISIGGLQGPFKAAQTASGGLNTAFKTLAANPIMIAITAIVAILVKAAAAIKQNEELTMRLQQALSVFKPVLDAISNAFDFLAGIIVKVVEGFAKFSAKVLSIIPGMKQAIKSHQELAKATNDLIKAQREASELNAKQQSEVEALRANAAAATDNAEKLKYLEEAKAKQAEIDQRNLELAQEDLRIKEALAEKTANDTQAEEELAAARKKVGDLTAEASRHEKEYNKQINTTTQAINNQNNTVSGGKSIWKQEEEELEKFNKQYAENLKTREQKTKEHYERLLALAKKHGKDTSNIESEYAKAQKENAETAQNEIFRARLTSLQAESDFYQQYYNKQIEHAENERDRAGLILTVAEENLNTFKDLYKQLNGLDFSLTDAPKVAEEIVSEMNAKLGLGIKFPPDIDEKNVKVFLANVAEFGKDLQNEFDEAGRQFTKALSLEEVYDRWNKFLKNVRESQHSLDEDFASGSLSFDQYNLKVAKLAATNLQQEIEIQKEILANQKLSVEERTELEEAYYANLAKMRENEWNEQQLQAQRSQELTEAAGGHFEEWNSSLSNVLGLWGSITQAQIDNGKLDEKETKRRQKRLKAIEKIQLAVAIANIASQTAQGIMGVWQGFASEMPVNSETAAATGAGAAAAKAALDAKSFASAMLRTGMIAAQGTAQVAAAVGGYISKSNAASDGGGDSTGVAAAPMLIDSTPYSYTRTVQTQEEEDAINQRPIVCSIVDIEDAMDARKVRVTETSF